LEAGLAFIVILAAQIYPLKFSPVRITANQANKSWEETINTSDFVTFNHRGSKLNKKISKA
jgi:hypothetical protein